MALRRRPIHEAMTIGLFAAQAPRPATPSRTPADSDGLEHRKQPVWRMSRIDRPRMSSALACGRLDCHKERCGPLRHRRVRSPHPSHTNDDVITPLRLSGGQQPVVGRDVPSLLRRHPVELSCRKDLRRANAVQRRRWIATLASVRIHRARISADDRNLQVGK